MIQATEYPYLSALLNENHQIPKEIRDVIVNYDENQKYEQNSDFLNIFEQVHQFIDLLFPNFLDLPIKYPQPKEKQSLTIIERDLIILNNKAKQQLLRTFYLYLRYLGLNQDYEVINKQQFCKCLFTKLNIPNDIIRILTSLSVLGFRKMAIQFLSHLKIYVNQFAIECRNISIETCFNTTYNPYNRYFQLFEEVHEENSQVTIKFEQRKKFYFSKTHFEQPYMNVNIFKDFVQNDNLKEYLL